MSQRWFSDINTFFKGATGDLLLWEDFYGRSDMIKNFCFWSRSFYVMPILRKKSFTWENTRHERGIIQEERNWGSYLGLNVCPGQQFSKRGLWNTWYSLNSVYEVKRWSSMQDFNVAKNKMNIDNSFKFYITTNL